MIEKLAINYKNCNRKQLNRKTTTRKTLCKMRELRYQRYKENEIWIIKKKNNEIQKKMVRYILERLILKAAIS